MSARSGDLRRDDATDGCSRYDDTTIHRWGVGDRAPDYKATETEWGTMYAAYRPADPGTYYYRFAHFLFPFITFTPNGFVRGPDRVHAERADG